MCDLVLVNWRIGEPAKTVLMIHTCISYATRRKSRGFVCTNFSIHMSAAESGMQPKALQKLHGHAGIKTTTDRYVPVG